MKSPLTRWGILLATIMTVLAAFGAIPDRPQNVRAAWLLDYPGSFAPFVQWEPANNADSYNVYRADETNSAWSLAATNVTVPFLADPLFALIPAQYAVTAVNSEGESTGSDPATVTEQYAGMLWVQSIAVNEGTLSPTNARVLWYTSWAAGDEGMVEWAPYSTGETNYPFFLINTNYQGGHVFNLTNLAPATAYQYRITSIGTLRGGVQARGLFTTPQTNRPPVPSFVILDTPWDTNLHMTLSAVDADAYDYSPPQTNGFRITSFPTNGTLFGPNQNWPWDAQAELTYQPNASARGLDWFEFVASDGWLDSPPVLVVISNWMNGLPAMPPILLHTPENTSVNLTLDDVDPDGDPLTFSLTGIYGGALSGTFPQLVFTPETNFFGTATVGYIVTDGYANGYGYAWIEVGVNSLPKPDGLRRRIYSDGIVRLWWNAVPGAVHYDVYRSEGGSAFTPIASGVTTTNFNDVTAEYQHNYSYRVRTWDGFTEGEPSASVLARWDDTGIITLNQQLWQILGTTGRVQFCSSLASGVEGLWEYGATTNYDRLLENTNLLGCQHFSLSNLTPQTIYQYRLTATDGNGNAIHYSGSFATQAPPVADSQGVATLEDTPLNITLTGSDPNPAGYSLTYSVVSGVAHGTLTPTGPNTYRYLPATNYFGADSFSFKVNNGELDSPPATVNLSVTAVNDIPVVANLSVITAEDTVRSIAPSFSDFDGGLSVSVLIVTPPAHGIAGTSGTNLMYLPATNYFGPDSFTYRVSDGYGFGNTATVSLIVTNVNDSPVATNVIFSTPEDSAITLRPTMMATDADGDAMTLLTITGAAHGLVVQSGTNLIYTPTANYFGSDSFTVRLSDGKVTTGNIVVSMTVSAVNDRPTANSQSMSTTEDTAKAIALSGSDVEGSPLTYTIASGPAQGSLTGSGAARIYTPALNYNGPDSFTFFVNDGSTNSTTATISITITAVNDAPVANALTVTLNEDTATNLVLTGSDADSNSLTYAVVVAPTNGVLAGNPPNVTYSPNPNFNGNDSFQFYVSDGLLSATNMVNLAVVPVNDAPVASSQSVTTDEDTVVAVVLTAGDVEGAALTYRVVTPPSHGALSGSAPNLTYTPLANYHGPDSFIFLANDGSAESAPVSVALTIHPLNDSPVATPQSISLPEDTSTNLVLAGTDVDGNPLIYAILSAPTNGTLSGTAPNLTYTPNSNFNGSDAILFSVTDDSLSSTGVVSLTITPVNDTPQANGASLATAEDSALPLTLTGNDVDGDTLTFSIVGAPTHGTLNGTFPNLIYTPAANFNGADNFTFKVNDGGVDSAAVTVTISVTPVNDAPIANAQGVNTPEDTAVSITLTGTDAETAVLLYTVISLPAHGTVSSTTSQTMTYMPAANYNGPDSMVFRVSDGTNVSTATVSLTVMAVNDEPVANPQSATVVYNTAQSLTLTGSDLEGNALTYTVVNTPTNGILSGIAPSLTYTPNIGSAGADFFTFRVSDGVSNSAAATVSITTQNPAAISTAPTALTVTVPTATGALILNWSCTATNEDGFKVERSLNGTSGWSQIVSTGMNIHTFTNTGSTSNTRYYYRVRSYNRLGNSAYSSTVNAKAR